MKDYSDAKVPASLPDEVSLMATVDRPVVDGKQKMRSDAEKISATDATAIRALIRSFKN